MRGPDRFSSQPAAFGLFAASLLAAASAAGEDLPPECKANVRGLSPSHALARKQRALPSERHQDRQGQIRLVAAAPLRRRRPSEEVRFLLPEVRRARMDLPGRREERQVGVNKTPSRGTARAFLSRPHCRKMVMESKITQYATR